MAASPGALSIAKNLDVADGANYTLSFDMNNRSRTGAIQISVGGEDLGTFSATDRNFEHVDIDFVGGIGDGSNRLVITEVGTNGNSGTGLANIQVN